MTEEETKEMISDQGPSPTNEILEIQNEEPQEEIDFEQPEEESSEQLPLLFVDVNLGNNNLK